MARFFQFSLSHVLMLMMLVGAFLAGRSTVQTTIRSLEERAFAAAVMRDDLQKRLSQEYARQSLDTPLRIRAIEVLQDVGQSFHCEVIQVISAGKIRVATGQQERTLSLYGIDCPELDEPSGKEAREFTSSLCNRTSGHVLVLDRGLDGNGNIVGVVIAGLDIINDELVRAGWARLNAGQQSPTQNGWQWAAQESKQGIWASVSRATRA